jgi:predicted RNA binding protein YcfA (HicA-like mRNA interferase family)
MVRFLESRGLRVLRIVGSHHFLDGGGKRTTVPVHGNRTLKIGTLRSILRDVEISPAEFERLWTE